MVHCLLEVLEEKGYKTASGRWFHRWEKQAVKVLRWAVGLNFGSLTRRELLEECMHVGVAGEGKRTERADADEAMLENRREKIKITSQPVI